MSNYFEHCLTAMFLGMVLSFGKFDEQGYSYMIFRGCEERLADRAMYNLVKPDMRSGYGEGMR